MDPGTLTTLLATALVIALIGALAGTAGFAALVVRRQDRRMADLIERLGSGPTAPRLIASQTGRVRDRRLREAVDQLAGRLADTWRLATVDPLTGVLNRQAVMSRLDAEIARASRYRRSLSVVLFDLDHFKRLNDTYGHTAGDLVLSRLAQALHGGIRDVDVLGRYGGEEFLLVLPETDLDAAAALAEKLRRAVGSREVVLPTGDRVTVTVSAGVTGGSGDELQLDDLVREADGALYSAKALGRDQVYVYRETGEEGLVPRAVIDPSARRRAVDVGRAATEAAHDHLHAALLDRPGWGGRPSNLIAEASIALARSVGLPDGEIDRIRTASLLHDLGKLAIPDDILAKPGELDEPEWRAVTEHPRIGQVVLEQAGALRDAATIVLHHHEWFNGRGYPHGLSGAEIPVGARIVAIVDAYEAMTSGRPYRPAIDHAAALDELRRQAGVQFDPELVEVFAVLFEAGMPWRPDSVPVSDHQHPVAVDAEASADGRTDEPVAPPRAAATRTRARGTGDRTGPPTTAELHDALHERRRMSRTGTSG